MIVSMGTMPIVLLQTRAIRILHLRGRIVMEQNLLKNTNYESKK